MINKSMTDKEIQKKEIEMKIRYWEGKMKYAKMRIEVNKKKLDQLQ
jgi:hypothetical protein|tara:strand:- start:692 stop:829 length:138 start_codon:yes stop_codon:yes gene_type:complete